MSRSRSKRTSRTRTRSRSEGRGQPGPDSGRHTTRRLGDRDAECKQEQLELEETEKKLLLMLLRSNGRSKETRQVCILGTVRPPGRAPGPGMSAAMSGEPSAEVPQPGSSKYDYVKVRVGLSDRHYYVLSRYLVSRVLTATKVRPSTPVDGPIGRTATLTAAAWPHRLEPGAGPLHGRHPNRVGAQEGTRRPGDARHDAGGHGRGAVHHSQEPWLRRRNLTPLPHGVQVCGGQPLPPPSVTLFTPLLWPFVLLLRTAPSFHHQRIPLIVLIGGAACVGKSTLATQLAERLNLSSVLQTDVAYALMASITQAATTGQGVTASAPRPSLRRQAAALVPDADEVAVLTALYDHECALVERGAAETLPSRSKAARRWYNNLT